MATRYRIETQWSVAATEQTSQLAVNISASLTGLEASIVQGPLRILQNRQLINWKNFTTTSTTWRIRAQPLNCGKAVQEESCYCFPFSDLYISFPLWLLRTFFFWKFIYLSIWLWVFTAALRLSLVAVSKDNSPLWCTVSLLMWVLLQHMGSRHWLSSCGAWA